MKQPLRLKLISLLLTMILVFSVPLSVYAKGAEDQNGPLKIAEKTGKELSGLFSDDVVTDGNGNILVMDVETGSGSDSDTTEKDLLPDSDINTGNNLFSDADTNSGNDFPTDPDTDSGNRSPSYPDMDTGNASPSEYGTANDLLQDSGNYPPAASDTANYPLPDTDPDSEDSFLPDTGNNPPAASDTGLPQDASEPAADQYAADSAQPSDEAALPARTNAFEPDPELPTADITEDMIEAASSYLNYASGSCGTSATWEFIIYTDDNTGNVYYFLIIDGSGAVTNAGWNTATASYGSLIQGLIIGENITSIGNGVFSGHNSLQLVTFNGKNCTSIGYAAFSSCPNLMQVNLKSGLTQIGTGAFYNCPSLSSVSIPSTVAIIDDQAFEGCTALASLTLPKSLTYVGSRAFYSCSAVYYPGTPDQWTAIGGPASVSSPSVVHYSESISGASISGLKKSYEYTGSAIKPKPTVTLNGKKLVKGTDYTVSYKNNKKRGTATVTVKGIKEFNGSVSKTFKITKKAVKSSNTKITGVKKMTYTGSSLTLSGLKVRVKVGSKYKTLKKGTDYTLKYSNNKIVSTSSKKASVKITFKGNYNGTLTKKFTIVRGTPGLSFAKSKVTAKAVTTLTKKVKMKAKKGVTVTYRSSNSAVASVDKKTGKVTPKKPGTVKITATSKATKNFKSQSVSYKLTVRWMKMPEVGYSFKNYSSGTLPLSTFKLFYSNTDAQAYWKAYKEGGNGGCCYGLSCSLMMFNTPGFGCTIKDFSPNLSVPYDVNWFDYRYSTTALTYKNTGITLEALVEAMHVSQWSPAARKLLLQTNQNQMAKLKNAVATGKPVMVIVAHKEKGGHALVGYKVKDSRTQTKIYVYDCNWPYEDNRYLTLYKNSAGSYTSWKYNMNSQYGSADYYGTNNGVLSFVDSASYLSIWKNRNAAKNISQLLIGSDNFELLDENGNTAAKMVNGVFTSYQDDIYAGYGIDLEQDGHMIDMPSGQYTVVNKEAGSMEVTALCNHRSATVATDADTVILNVQEDSALATIEAEKGESYEVTILSDTEEGEEKEIAFAGEGDGTAVTLGTEGDTCVMENGTDVSLSIDGEEVAYAVSDGEAVFQE